MPKSPLTTPPQYGPYGPFLQALQSQNRQIQNLTAGAQQGAVYDGQMNAVALFATNLDQVVTIGAQHMSGGVQVWTGFANGTAGIATQKNLAIGTITLTEGSTSATLDSTTVGSFGGGANLIGAYVENPDGTTENAIGTRTTFTISGTAVTLSTPALVSGTGLYCAACSFTQL